MKLQIKIDQSLSQEHKTILSDCLSVLEKKQNTPSKCALYLKRRLPDFICQYDKKTVNILHKQTGEELACYEF